MLNSVKMVMKTLRMQLNMYPITFIHFWRVIRCCCATLFSLTEPRVGLIKSHPIKFTFSPKTATELPSEMQCRHGVSVNIK